MLGVHSKLVRANPEARVRPPLPEICLWAPCGSGYIIALSLTPRRRSGPEAEQRFGSSHNPGSWPSSSLLPSRTTGAEQVGK